MEKDPLLRRDESTSELNLEANSSIRTSIETATALTDNTSTLPEQNKTEENKGICRICLEDDMRSNLEEPCACKGTAQFAHHSCLQRWINEPRHTDAQALVCEICKQEYTGNFTVPPPRPPPATRNENRVVVLLIDPETGMPRPMATTIDASDDDYDEYQHERLRPATACCITFILFMLCSLLLTHLFTLPENPAEIPPSEGIPTSPDDVQFEDVSATLLLVWLLMRLMVIVAPVYTLNQFLTNRHRRAVLRRSEQGEELQIVVHSPQQIQQQ